MDWRPSVILVVAMCVLATAAVAGESKSSNNPEVDPVAVAALRERGPEGLAEALASYDKLRVEIGRLQEEINRLAQDFEGQKEPIAAIERQMAELNGQLNNWRVAIDQIGGQRTCAVSRLYWYTSLDEAKAAAERTGRPILSLRMLGKLTDEFSCANSRFFRTSLYSNTSISDYLRDHFVLHWQSVRPVPRVTIDFGDGRKLERTLTGNSAHYVLTSAGEPLDVLPGLYSPQEFQTWLERMNQFHRDYAVTSASERAQKLVEFHAQRRRQVYRQWADDVKQLGNDSETMVATRIDQAIDSASRTKSNSQLAVAASKLAESKWAAESRLLRLANFSGPWIEHGMDDELWQAIANLRRGDVKLDEASVAVMQQEFPRAGAAAAVAIGKSVTENPILRAVRTFENSIALDTVRNEYLLHRRIHEAFADRLPETTALDFLNDWVYAELFLTPSKDPWLGLAPPDVYTALENDGRREGETEVMGAGG